MIPVVELTELACTELLSWKIWSLTCPSSLICGLTRSVKPTSLRSTVWNGFTEPLLLPVLVNEPVTKGTFWPITMRASSLSNVSKLGVERMLPSPLVSMKRARKPNTDCPLRVPTPAKFNPVEGAGVPAAMPAARLKILTPPLAKLVPSTAALPNRV